MKFNLLKEEVISLVKKSKDNVSLYITTDEGDITYNENSKISAASVIKLPIAIACLHEYDRGELDIYEDVVIRNKVGGTGVLNYLFNMEKLPLINLIELAIIVSDNTASNILINLLGKKKINGIFEKVGATNTILAREFMDHKSLNSGLDNVTSAKDMMTFLMCLHNDNDILSNTSKTMLYDMLGDQQFKDKLASYHNIFNKELYIGNKTGTLNGVEHDVAIFEKDGSKIYISVLSTGWQYNYDGRQMIAEIGNKLLKYMSNNT